MPIMQRIDQLHVYEDAISSPPDAAFEDIGHTQRATDVAQIPIRAAILHDRGATDYFEVADLGQARQDIVLNPIGEERIRLVFTQIFERQNRDAFLGNALDNGLRRPAAMRLNPKRSAESGRKQDRRERPGDLPPAHRRVLQVAEAADLFRKGRITDVAIDEVYDSDS